MNPTIEKFTRQQILDGRRGLPEGWQSLFKRMYAHKTPDADIEAVVKQIQVENSYKKLGTQRS